MPKILIFIPCEKVITSVDGPISIISVTEKLITTVPQGQNLPEHATVPMRWTVLSVWNRQISDEGKRFEQMVRLVTNDGIVAMHTEATEIVTAPGKERFRIVALIEQFPITDGNLNLLLLYREIGAEEWAQVAEYPIHVELQRTS